MLYPSYCLRMITISNVTVFSVLSCLLLAYLVLPLLLLLQVTIKAADSSISRDARKELVAGISQALPQHLQCLSGDRIYM
jgi:hypothetical protein